MGSRCRGGLTRSLEGLSHLNDICLRTASGISATPPNCGIINAPMPSVESVYNTFYRIYKHDERSDLVDSTLKRLDFHPLLITL